METTHREALNGFKQATLKKRIPQHIVEACMWIMTKEMNQDDRHIQDTHNTQVKEAITYQLEIGVDLMLQGFLAIGWC